jgi:hypothetical protein
MGKTSKFQPKVLGRVLEKMKENKAGRIMGKGVKTHGSGRSLACGLQYDSYFLNT